MISPNIYYNFMATVGYEMIVTRNVRFMKQKKSLPLVKTENFVRMFPYRWFCRKCWRYPI